MSATVLLILIAKLAILLAMGVAAGIDISRRIIPNKTVLVVAAAGLLIRLLSPQESSIFLSIAVAVAVLVSLGLLGRGAFLGGGDIKMISAATLAVPLHNVLALLLHIALAGGVVSVFYLARGLIRPRACTIALQGEVSAAKSIDLSASIPYGVAILLGVVSLHVAKVFPCSAANFCWL